MTKGRFGALGAAVMIGALLLGGCSSAAPAPAPSTEQTEDAGQVPTAAELTAVLEQFALDYPGSQVLSDQQLRDSIPAAEAWLQEVEVSPEECGLVMSAPLKEQLSQAAMAALQLEDSFITLAGYTDAEQLAQNFDAELERNERCSRYTVLNDGRRIAFHTALQELPTQARRTMAHVLTSSDGKASDQQIMVKVAHRNVMMTINQPLQNNAQAEQFESLSEQVNELLAALE